VSQSFKVGDRVVVVKDGPTPGRVGSVAVVIGVEERFAAHEYEKPGPWSFLPKGTVMYILDLPPAAPGWHVAFPGTHLEPYRDDGNERGEWTEELRRLCKTKVSA
jgi:hypothetical protein